MKSGTDHVAAGPTIRTYGKRAEQVNRAPAVRIETSQLAATLGLALTLPADLAESGVLRSECFSLNYVWRCPLKQFLAVYLGSPEAMGSWNALSESERNTRTAQGVRAWHVWVNQHRELIVIDGGPLGRTKSINHSGISDIRNAMTAFTVVRAESHEAAAKLFEGHPHFSIFPGESVEVMECLPIPESISQS